MDQKLNIVKENQERLSKVETTMTGRSERITWVKGNRGNFISMNKI